VISATRDVFILAGDNNAEHSADRHTRTQIWGKLMCSLVTSLYNDREANS